MTLLEAASSRNLIKRCRCKLSGWKFRTSPCISGDIHNRRGDFKVPALKTPSKLTFFVKFNILLLLAITTIAYIKNCNFLNYSRFRCPGSRHYILFTHKHIYTQKNRVLNFFNITVKRTQPSNSQFNPWNSYIYSILKSKG